MQLGSSADLRRRFRTGRTCLDLVHTGGDDVLAQFEIINAPDDLGRLLATIMGIAPPVADHEDLTSTKALRSALTRVAYHLADGSTPIAIEPPRPSDRATLNSVAAQPPLVPELKADGTAGVAAPTVPAVLSSIARDAIDLFGGPRAHRMRVCAADNCGLLLLDTSRAGRRRWCSMDSCGNRAKVRAHRSPK